MAVLAGDDDVLSCQNLAQGWLLASFLLVNISCGGCLGMGVLFPAFGLNYWAFSQI